MHVILDNSSPPPHRSTMAAARHADCNAMKTNILLLLGFYQGSDTLKPDVKENHGYHHALTTAFICPTGVDPNDSELALVHSLVIVNANIHLPSARQLKRLKGGGRWRFRIP